MPVANANSPQFSLDTAFLATANHSVWVSVHDDTSLVRTDPTGKLTTTKEWLLEVIDQAPQLSLQPKGPHGILIKVSSQAGGNVVIEASENLIDWRLIAVQVNTTGTFEVMDSPGNAGPHQFYRVRQLEP